ncbi:acyl-CoA esterase [Thalassovita gelatinovora]|uniref:Acyl-CoA esterase n=1 Tax=Thalassovita gelatinovora TaxID=53501 RepID=A0A0P1FPC0_THAGE|nr:alpha/beta fold hydrolase [Thalassovita gelatinovora]QIZ79515.1 alpha/beta hydrolase [Thalassovita gelatinovora]CUH62948.1 acyl-CoA esterase [Thalassovita gelatinovora]SEQ12928.1 Lysophospholipase, alpha-beta hydrolase superfamily [Thalassovita gelatinovora]
MIWGFVRVAAISAAVPLAIALGLIGSQRPGEMTGSEGLDFSRQITRQTAPLPIEKVTMRDGFGLSVRSVPGPQNRPLVVLVHGSGWHGGQFDGLARQLADKADVLVPDLRGHGVDPGRRGDVDYIGQFEDDLADLIRAKAKPGQKVVLAGHSSGGGLVVRFAGGAHGDLIEGAALMAPFLKYNAPTTRPNSGGWADVLTRRIIGLSMLNTVGIKALNALTVIQFNMPESVLNGPLGATATTAYSYRLNSSFAPRRGYEKDIAALPRFLLIAGREDEAFFAERYEPLMSEHNPEGRYVLIDGVSHLDVVDAPQTLSAIGDFIDGI